MHIDTDIDRCIYTRTHATADVKCQREDTRTHRQTNARTSVEILLVVTKAKRESKKRKTQKEKGEKKKSGAAIVDASVVGER